MSETERFVGVLMGGVKLTHLPAPTAEYITLCGLAGDNDGYGIPDNQIEVQRIVKAGRKVNCAHCRAIFEVCQKYTIKDFKHG